MRFPFVAAAFAATLLSGCGGESTPGSAVVENAWVRLPPVPGRPGAAYFTLRVGRPEVLTSVSTPAAARAEMHESMEGGTGMASMRPLETLALPEGETLKFAPGGKHVMLFDLKPGLKPGTTVPLHFRFAKEAPITVQATLIAAGESYESH